MSRIIYYIYCIIYILLYIIYIYMKLYSMPVGMSIKNVRTHTHTHTFTYACVYIYAYVCICVLNFGTVSLQKCSEISNFTKVTHAR
jgi:hypothetical protein